MTTIQVASQKTILRSNILEFKEEKIKVGNHVATYHNLYRVPAVMILPVTPTYEVFLVSQYRYLYKKRCLEVIAGYTEKGESTLQSAKRELQEEAGLIASNWEEILRTELAASSVKGTMHIFLATRLEETNSNREITEDIEVLKIPLSQAVSKAALGEIHDAPAIAGILLLDKLKREKKI